MSAETVEFKQKISVGMAFEVMLSEIAQRKHERAQLQVKILFLTMSHKELLGEYDTVQFIKRSRSKTKHD